MNALQTGTVNTAGCAMRPGGILLLVRTSREACEDANRMHLIILSA